MDATERTQENTFDEAMPYAGLQQSSNIENLEARNITLKQKEEDNRLSFNKNTRLANIQSTGVIEEYDEGIMSQQTRGITNPLASQINSHAHPPDSAGFASHIPSSQAARGMVAKSVRPDIGGYQS